MSTNPNALVIRYDAASGMHHLRGDIDGEASLQALLSQAVPLKLNLRDVRKINSQGILVFLRFLERWDKPIEYHECPATFISVMDVFPALLGRQVTVRSLHMPFLCHACNRPFTSFIDRAVTREQGFRCPNCGAVAKPEDSDVDVEAILARVVVA